MAICKEYFDRITILEGEKYEHEYNTAKKDFEKRELSAKVNDVRGKLYVQSISSWPKQEPITYALC